MYSARRGRARGKRRINLLLLHYRVREFKKGKYMEYENFGKEDNYCNNTVVNFTI